MVYRTMVDGVQLFDNGKCYDEWYDYIRSEGIDVADDGSYSGEIHNVDKALSVLGYIAYREVKESGAFSYLKECFSFFLSPDGSDWDETVDVCDHFISTSVLFLTYHFLEIVKEKVEKTYNVGKGRILHIELKPGEVVKVQAGE